MHPCQMSMTKGHPTPIPINDLHTPPHDLKASIKSTNDYILRRKLAATCRLIDKYNLANGIYNHVSVRSADHKNQFMLNPFGLGYDEITASSIMKVDFNGNIKDRGSTKYGLNQSAYVLHSAIHAVRHDIHCVLHVHTQAGSAVSSLKNGLLPISQEALMNLSDVSYHSYEGILSESSFRDSIAKSLGPKNKTMILHNHGIVACGETIEEAWLKLFNLVLACEVQCKALAAAGGDQDKLIHLSEDVEKPFGVGLNLESDVNWKFGDLQFEAEMRWLDHRGLKTGYPYKLKPLHFEPLASP